MRLDTFDDAFVIWQTVETCRAPCQQVSAALDVAELAPRDGRKRRRSAASRGLAP